MNWRFGFAVLLLASGAASAQPQSAPVAQTLPQGEAQAGDGLRDREFGVITNEFGLDRRVEMYQWQRSAEDAYQRVWKAALVDSSGFAPGHDNPAELPLDGRRWWSQTASLDGKPLDVQVLKVLGQWQDFRPNFSRLPGNMSATFQPDGDGLTSSENPLDPRTGDLRISWRELTLPPLADKVELRDGVWRLAPQTRAAPGTGVDRMPQVETMTQARSDSGLRWWPWLLGALALVFVVVVAKRRRPRG